MKPSSTRPLTAKPWELSDIERRVFIEAALLRSEAAADLGNKTGAARWARLADALRDRRPIR